MRTITDHIVEGDSLNHQLTVLVTDDPGAGGANHEYRIGYPGEGDGRGHVDVRISFQNGAIKEHGVNGITETALLAIVIDRLRAFQGGPFPTDENLMALNACRQALWMLHHRTRQRLARGVEGRTVA